MSKYIPNRKPKQTRDLSGKTLIAWDQSITESQRQLNNSRFWNRVLNEDKSK